MSTSIESGPGVKNRGFCNSCGKVVEIRHETREGKVLLVKSCPECGDTESVVSTDAGRYQRKREMVDYQGEAERTCGLNCMNCNHGKKPTLVFLDVTNRCNMNCPICLANIPAMGFRFDPPMEYFEKVFAELEKIDPKPRIQLFGGEPTVRKDIVDIIKRAKAHGLQARVVTNGLRLADEKFCKELLSTGCQLMFAFDGRNPKIYERIRKSPKALELKLKAMENVRKYRKSKITIMCTTGDGVNDEFIGDLVDFCHEYRDTIAALDMIPLQAHWGPEEVDAQSSTIEDVERIMRQAVPGVEYVPAGALMQFDTMHKVFNVRVTFGGAHPNCESVSMLVSDGQGYHSTARYLKRPFTELVEEAIGLDRRMGPKVDSSFLGRLFGLPGKRLVYGWAIFKFLQKNLKMREIFGGSPWLGMAKIVGGLLTGGKGKDLLRRHTKCHGILRLIVLPFEELGCVEAARLVDCPAAFAYEHPETEQIRLMPVCTWPAFKNDILRQSAQRWPAATVKEEEALSAS